MGAAVKILFLGTHALIFFIFIFIFIFIRGAFLFLSFSRPEAGGGAWERTSILGRPNGTGR